jgi:hypothetical protein
MDAACNPAEDTHDSKWILNHLSRISNTALPRIFKGDPDYTPEGWPEDYRDQTYGLERLLGDIATGKEAVLEGLGGLTSAALAEDIPLWGGTRKREFGIFAYLGEIINHKGQLAALRGIIKRRQETDASFLA